jgi:hypothetical protein
MLWPRRRFVRYSVGSKLSIVSGRTDKLPPCQGLGAFWGVFKVALQIRLYTDRFSFVLLKWMFVNVFLIDFSY